MRHIILGTAGHIDHGKSTLVKSLTGTDPDRLKEEKERGITIDIGFADLVYPKDDLSVSIVDVPGHERLIRNMLAGAGGIDMVLLVIAADEGIMPQSREHLAICNMLRIKAGLIAITKADLVDPEWLSLVADEVRSFVKGTFLENAPVVPVSSRTGFNLDVLNDNIRTIATGMQPKSTDGLFRMPIDRVFTLKGFGTVITGTAISGKISLEDQIEILPAAITSKVRGLHSHGRAIQSAYAGQRVAINLQAVEKETLRRGDVAVTPLSFRPGRILDIFLELLNDAPELMSRSLLHFYCGTSETTARVILFDKEKIKGGESAYCQLRLMSPVIVMSGDRYIVRRFSPLQTLGGGEVLDPSPGKRRRKDGIADLVSFHSGNNEEKIGLKIEKSGQEGMSSDSVRGWINLAASEINSAINNLLEKGDIIRCDDTLIHKNSFAGLQQKVIGLIRSYHSQNPLKGGMQKEEIRNLFRISPALFNCLLERLPVVVDKNLVRLKDFKIALTGVEESSKTGILEILEKNGFQPPLKEEIRSALKMDEKNFRDMLGILLKEGRIVKINDSIYVSTQSFNKMTDLLKDFFAKNSELTVAQFRDILQTSRKYALPYLEYLDATKVTIRTGDVRKLLQKKA